MSTPTQSVEVTEFLRPEGTHESVEYHVSPFIASRVQKLKERGLEVCCDIYPAGNCRVYIYDSVMDLAVASTPVSSQHSIATHLLSALVGNFDFSRVM